MAEKANRRSENLTGSKARSTEHLTVYCVEVEKMIRTRRCAFHQGQGHRDPHRKVGYGSSLSLPDRTIVLANRGGSYMSLKRGNPLHGFPGVKIVVSGYRGSEIPINTPSLWGKEFPEDPEKCSPTGV